MKLIDLYGPVSSLPHDSAHLHVAGLSEFVDDRPLRPGEVMVGLIYSPHARARIKLRCVKDALKAEGVLCALTAQDVAHNRWGAIIPEQPLLAEREVNYVGEVIAIIGALSREALYAGARAVRIEYEPLPAILTIDDAIKQECFIGGERQIARGDALTNIKAAPHQKMGSIRIKGADHFYLENNAAIAYPLENGAMEIHSSTQHPTETQMLVAEALGVPYHSVVCVTKRLGGGFGGKETQAAPFAAYAALVARATGRAARIVLSKDDDMIVTGKRNPYLVNYFVGFAQNGTIAGLDCQFFGDGGAYADLSTSILERAMAHVDNAYFLEHVRIRGIVCRTNFHPHTAFRGFGGPKGVALIEHVMEEIAHTLQVDALDVRLANCYRGERNTTPYGQVVKNNLLPELFLRLETSANYRERRAALFEWNRKPSNNPRGMSLTAIKFGISFTTRFLNQGHALVHVFRDGSVQVSTGAVEMGQGVQARIRHLVAESFGIDEQCVRMMPTATDRSANTSPTAASSGTDLNGSAALNACAQIRARLASLCAQLEEIPEEHWPKHAAAVASAAEIDYCEHHDEVIFSNGEVYLKRNPKHRFLFAELANQAYLSRLSLSAYGFYKVANLDFNKLTGTGNAFLYFTQGVACSEVELDRTTGEVKILRSDILMDLGRPINDALDRGQITGAFIQGVGWVTTENLYYDRSGLLRSHSPSTYKIPSVHDIPRVFNVELVENNANVVNVRGTKASGEPPLMLCFSVWNAIKDAIAKTEGRSAFPNLPIPATAEVVLRALKPSAFHKFDHLSTRLQISHRPKQKERL